MNPLFKECRPIGLSELPQFFPRSVPLQSWVVKSTFHLQILTHYGYCAGSDSTLFNASQTAQVWKSDPGVHAGILVLSQMMPQWCTTPISELRKNWTFWSLWASGSGTGTHLSGRSMEAAAMQWTGAVHIDLVHIFQSLPVYCNHLVSCGNTSSQASECHYNSFQQS